MPKFFDFFKSNEALKNVKEIWIYSRYSLEDGDHYDELIDSINKL